MTHESDVPNPNALVRLQRYLASCGLGARRSCEDFITAGRVTVDGLTVTELGTRIDPLTQRVALDGEKLRMERKKYFVFYKPPGVLCTNRDPQARPRVIDFFPKDGPRLFTVGRLDEESEGLLIVTNDGDLAQKMAHPSHRIFRTYHVLVAGLPSTDVLYQMKQGMYFAEGRFKVEGAKMLKKQGKSTWCELILAEGHNREVRRLFSRVGHKVMKLQRVAFGPIFLGRMARGEIREIRKDEMERLVGMLERNEGVRDEGRNKRAARPRRSMDSSSASPPPRGELGRLVDAPTRDAPTRAPRTEMRGPVDSTPRPPRAEARGLGVGEVSDEEMMGMVDRPARTAPPRGKRPFKAASRPRDEASSERRPPRERTGERSADRPADRRTGERKPKGAAFRGAASKSAAPRGAVLARGPVSRSPAAKAAAESAAAAKPRGLVRKPFDRPPTDRPIKAGTRIKRERPDADRPPSETKGLGRRSPGQPFSHKKPKGAKSTKRGK